MVKLIILASFVLMGTSAYNQGKVENVNEYLYNEAYKNIAAYNIRYANEGINGVHFEPRFWGTADIFYRWFFPEPGYKLKMKIEKFDSLYPDAKFQLYKIHLDGFSYVPNDHNLPEIGSLGPVTTKDFLIALNENNGDVKFVSGQFFESNISNVFNVDLKNPASLLSYLSLRFFCVGAKDIHFSKKKRKKLWYDAYSDVFHRPFRIYVDRKNADQTDLIYTKVQKAKK